MSKYIKLEDAIELINHYRFGIDKFAFECMGERLTTMPIIEVSEDCISREWVKGICEAMLDEEMLGHMLGHIEDAPSVVVRNNRTTTEQSCDTCRHNKLEWFSEECDGCTKANSNWERIRPQGEWIDRCRENEDYECSECGGVTEKFGGQYLYDYCPFCGAKMKG